MTSQGYALARAELIRALTAYSGITTSDGAADGTTLVDSNLIGRNDFITEKAILIVSGDAQNEDKGAASFNNVNGTITLQGTGFSAKIVTGTIYRILNISSVEIEVGAIAAALGNIGADMSAVTQSDAASLAAYIKQLKEHYRAHDQTRICLVVPDLANLASDLPNTAIKAELDKMGSVSLLDQTGVDGGQEDWEVYDLVVVGSNDYAAFVNTNIDDLILYHGPIMVCNRDVAMHLKIGATQTQSASDTNEYCQTIANRVMQLIFGSVGEKVLFDSAQVSDRLDMSDADLTEQVLMVDAAVDDNTKVVVGWLPAESPDAETYELNDGSTLPSGRLFTGCFVHADHLTDLGKSLLRRLARNLTQAHLHPLSVQVKRGYQEDIPDTDVSDTATTTEADCVLLELGPKISRKYCLRNLRIKAQADPAANTMTVRLYEYFEGDLVEVDSFAIATGNWGTYHPLMDMFGVPEVHSDAIKVTCEMSADTLAVKATYSYAEAKK
jgi:hypothetical protein